MYLVPVGPDRFECYYEAEEQDEPVEPVQGQGFIPRMRAKFNEQLQEAERARHEQRVEEAPTFLGRMQKRTMRWIAARVAEQRLLWQLRKAPAATLYIPSDLTKDEADAILRASMKRDGDFHRSRLVLHTLGLLLSIPVALLPGPNALGYLFTFTVVGHYLAWRGAVRGLHEIPWSIEPCPPLADLRHAFSLDAGGRHQAIHDVATRLRLPRMATFVEQMAAPT
ncbi:MAG: hypothetical protein ABI983_10340 [Acidobacteriota bacterium]